MASLPHWLQQHAMLKSRSKAQERETARLFIQLILRFQCTHNDTPLELSRQAC